MPSPVTKLMPMQKSRRPPKPARNGPLWALAKAPPIVVSGSAVSIGNSWWCCAQAASALFTGSRAWSRPVSPQTDSSRTWHIKTRMTGSDCFPTSARGWKHFLRIEQRIGIETISQASHDLQLGIAEEPAHEILLFHSYTVLAG